MKKHIAISFLLVSSLLIGMDNPDTNSTRSASYTTKSNMDKVKTWFEAHPQYAPQADSLQSEHQKKMNLIFESMDLQWEKMKETVSFCFRFYC